MGRTRKQIVSVAAGVILAAFGGAVTILGTPWLGWWLMVVGIGATVVALRPEWFMNRHWYGKRTTILTPVPPSTVIAGMEAPPRGPFGIVAGDKARIDIKDSRFSGLGTAIVAGDDVKVTAKDTEFTGPSGIVPRVGRNDPCPCGSGKKFKKCHGEN